MIKSATDSIGNTPLLSLKNITKSCCAKLFVKQESRNPLGSVKDRIALAM
ncbi:MAG: pyridoxal-phosphate dependent enzyme, partial [Desulfocapsa sp.]|nr:pyridoxal-phosphate dependent enzyme [Desulfocapsa sp.]